MIMDWRQISNHTVIVNCIELGMYRAPNTWKSAKHYGLEAMNHTLAMICIMRNRWHGCRQSIYVEFSHFCKTAASTFRCPTLILRICKSMSLNRMLNDLFLLQFQRSRMRSWVTREHSRRQTRFERACSPLLGESCMSHIRDFPNNTLTSYPSRNVGKRLAHTLRHPNAAAGDTPRLIKCLYRAIMHVLHRLWLLSFSQIAKYVVNDARAGIFIIRTRFAPGTRNACMCQRNMKMLHLRNDGQRPLRSSWYRCSQQCSDGGLSASDSCGASWALCHKTLHYMLLAAGSDEEEFEFVIYTTNTVLCHTFVINCILDDGMACCKIPHCLVLWPSCTYICNVTDCTGQMACSMMS